MRFINPETGEVWVFVHGSKGRKPYWRRPKSKPPTPKEDLNRRNFATLASLTFNTNDNPCKVIQENMRGKTAIELHNELTGDNLVEIEEGVSVDKFLTALREVAGELNAL